MLFVLLEKVIEMALDPFPTLGNTAKSLMVMLSQVISLPLWLVVLIVFTFMVLVVMVERTRFCANRLDPVKVFDVVKLLKKPFEEDSVFKVILEAFTFDALRLTVERLMVERLWK